MRRIFLLAALAALSDCSSCETDTGRYEEDISAAVPEDFSPRPALASWSRWTNYLPPPPDLTSPPDLTDPCGGQGQRCCDGRACSGDLVCAYTNVSCTPDDTSTCATLSAATSAGSYCIANNSCAPCNDGRDALSPPVQDLASICKAPGLSCDPAGDTCCNGCLQFVGAWRCCKSTGEQCVPFGDTCCTRSCAAASDGTWRCAQ